MYSPIVDCVTLLAAFAGATTRVRLGTAVYLVPLRHPVVTAKIFAGLDYVSNGRLVFGAGVGGEFAREFEAVGVPHGERGSRTDEGLEVIQLLWREPRASFAGRHFHFTDVALEPRPIQRPHPPIWIGGRSEAALRRTARFARGWLAYMATPERISASTARIRDLAPAFGRAPRDIETGLLLFAFIGRDRETARGRVVADLSTRYHQPFEGLVDRYCVFGTPAQCAESIERFVAAGVSELVVKLTCAPDEQIDQQSALAEGVLPLLRRAS